jgi:hypothetical protein
MRQCELFYRPCTIDFELSQSSAPPSVVVAKVKATGVNWRGNRHGEGSYSTRHEAQVEIIDVISGDSVKDTKVIVSFGVPGSQKYMYPRTPSMRAREYFIAFFIDQNQERRLIGFPASEPEYEQQNREFLDYARQQSRPGARDRRCPLLAHSRHP